MTGFEESVKLARDFAVPIETVIPLEATIEEALLLLRKKRIQQKIIYFYVVDDRHKLKGVVSTRQLLLAEPDRRVEEIMQDAVIQVRADFTLKQVLEIFSQHPLLALPVVDEEGRFLGGIDVQMVTNEAVDLADSRNRADIFQIIGLSLEDGKKVPLFHSYRLRMPWILCNVFSGIMCAIISRYYEVVLGRYLLLAFFIPLVLTLSESTSMQSMTQSLLFLRRPRFRWKTAVTRGFREWQLMIFIAVTSSLLVGGISLFWGDGFIASIPIAAGIFVGVTLSVLFGIGLPVLLHRFKLDPKVASGPVVLMIADMLTTAFYLGFATWLLI